MRNSQQYRYEERQRQDNAAAINVAQIVKVTAYDKNKQTVDVQPLVKRLENGTYQSQPPVLGVPIVCDLCAKYGKKVEYKEGDVGLIVFCDADIDKAVSDGTEGEPNTERNHSATDAVFIGGIRAGSAQDALPDGYAMGTKDGSVYLVIKETGLEILGDTKVEGDVEITGDVTFTCNVSVTGNISVTGGITTTADVVAGGKSLMSHTHTSMTPGTPTSAPL